MKLSPVPKPKNYCRCGCGAEIKATRKWVSGHNLRRRSKDAIVRNGRTYVKINCSECRTKFERRSDQVNRYGKVNFCSKKCVSKYQSRERTGKPIPLARNGEYRKCRNCFKEYYINPYRAKKTNSRYCSNKCQFDYQRKKGIVPKGFVSSANNKGKNNGMYRHGKRTGGNISRKELRKQIANRDGGDWCLLCGKPGPGLHLHRIIYGSQGGKYELDNCVQLCPIDHDKVHSSKKKWMPILLDHIKNGSLYNGGK